MIDKISILVVEDNLQDFLILKEYIKRTDGFEVEIDHAANIEEARTSCLTNSYDLIFLDLFLPDAHGRDTFIKLYGEVNDTPIIVLSGLADKKIALEIVQLGAQDYIVKGEFDELLIEKAIIYSIERHKNQKELSASERRYRLTVQNAGVGLAEYDASALYTLIEKFKEEGKDETYLIDLSYEELLEIRSHVVTDSLNPALYLMFECSSAKDFIESHYQHHTTNSLELMRMILSAIWTRKDQVKGISKYNLKSGKKVILLNRFTFFGYEDGTCKFVRSATDITTLKEKEYQIEKQQYLAERLSEASLALLGKGDPKAQLNKALSIKAASFDSEDLGIIQIFDEDGEKFIRPVYRWSNGIPPEEYINEWIFQTPLGDLGFNLAAERLKKGEFIRFEMSSEEGVPDSFVKIMGKAGIKSLLAAPVFLKTGLWAAVIFINYKEEKKWSEDELVVAKSFSNAIGSFLVRNKAEEKLQELNEELEDRIEKRTEELTDAIEELESFSYSVSHDLRAPLRKVGGFSQILDKEYGDSLPDRASHLLNNIKEGATEMSHLIHDLLEFSRLGRQSLSFNVINMTELCHEIIYDTSQTYNDLNIHFKVSELDESFGDRTLVKHILNNLVWNAVKFSSKNEKIEIEIYSSKEKNFCHYSVKDNGIGLDMNYAHKVFSVFQRLHTREEYEGTGVGLAIVKRIVKKHGGAVNVEGEVNKGCTFTFSLPRNQKQLSKSSELLKKHQPELIQ